MPTSQQLSTGQLVSLPLEVTFTLGGVTVLARRRALEAQLPAPLSPLAVAPGLGLVSIVGIQYHRVSGPRTPAGGEATESTPTGFEPYNEFAVIIPAVRAAKTDVPYAQLAGAEIGGFVHWLPVTTEASVALGRELWGYPKERAEITITDGPTGVRTTIGDCHLEVGHARRCPRSWRMYSYTIADDRLLRTTVKITGAIGIGTGRRARLEGLSTQPELAALGRLSRPLTRLYGTRVQAQLEAGVPVARRRS